MKSSIIITKNLSFIFLTLLLSACGNDDSSSSPQTPLKFSSSVSLSDEINTVLNATCKSSTPLALNGIFVSTNGNANALGTKDDPLDLATALSASSPVEKGETIWVQEGVYEGSFVSRLEGNSSALIKVKPMPGDRVVIDNSYGDSSGLSIQGSWTEYYGFEVLSRQLDRDTESNSYADIEFKITGGVTVGGAGGGSNTKVINFIVHDNVGGGFSSWSDAPNSELYGNIIYNNGWTAPGRGHGHAIYSQNRTGFKKLTDNVIFFGFGTGIHVYTEGGQIEGFDVQDNVWYMTGSSDPRASQRKDNCLIGGYQPVKNLTLKNNFGYSHNSRGTRIGYGGDVIGQSAVVSGNYLSENFWVAGYWDELNVSSTVVHRGTTGVRQDQVTDLGLNELNAILPISGKKIDIKANLYDVHRARVVIYNYDNDESVDVNLSSVVNIGETYRIHSSFALFKEPILSAIYDGSLVSIPMDSVEAPQPNGLKGIEDADNPHKLFGVFIVTHDTCL